MISVESQFNLGGLTRCDGVGLAGEDAEVFLPSVCLDLRDPLLHPPAPMHANTPRRVVGRPPQIARVLGSTHQPQVTQPVVCLVPVDVVNFLRRPFAVHHRHDDAVGEERCFIDAAALVPGCPYRSERLFASVSGVDVLRHVISLFPKQLPRLRFIAKKLMEGINVW